MRIFDGSLKRALDYHRTAKELEVFELARKMDPFRCNCCGARDKNESAFNDPLGEILDEAAWYEDGELQLCGACNYDMGSCCNFGPLSAYELELFREELIHILPIPGLWKRKFAYYLWLKRGVPLNPTVFHPGGRWL